MSEIIIKRTKRTLITYKNLIHGFKDKVNAYEQNIPSINKLKGEIETLNTYWSEYRKLYETLVELTTNDDEASGIEEAFMLKCQEYHGIKNELNELIGVKQGEDHDSSTRPELDRTDRRPQVRLRKLDVPKFSGKVTDWISFWDIFKSLVHDNDSLTDVEKFQHLLSSLDNEPRDQIRSLSLTEANYDVAIKLLQDRYNNRRVIVFERLKCLFVDLQPVTREPGKTLRALLDTVTKETLALQAMGFSFEEKTSNLILTYMVLQKIDHESYKWWNMGQKAQELPTWENLRDHLNNRCLDLESRETKTSIPSQQQQRPSQQFNNRPKAHAHNATTRQYPNCRICLNESHPLFKCPKFNSMSLQDKQSHLSQNKLCKICFSGAHQTKDCQSTYKCRTCKKNHHSLLHEDRSKGASVNHMSVGTTNFISRSVFLPTAVVRVKGANNRYLNCRVLIDQGSQLSIISEECVKTLGIKRKASNITVVGIGNGECDVKGQVDLTLKSMFSNYSLNMEAVILPKVTSTQPTHALNIQSLECFKDLALADANYFKPGKIDILLGAGEIAQIIRAGLVKSNCGSMAQDTEFGFIISGSTQSLQTHHVYHIRAISNHTMVENQIRNFLQIEEIPEPKQVHLSPEEEQCEQHFASTHTRDETGRFIVRLPLKENVSKLGDSRSTAFRRLLATERRLEKVPEKKPTYVEFLEEYESLGHMTNVTTQGLRCMSYLPHHFVEKVDSTTTKLRVVFDASCKTSTGVSLNDTLMVGPKLQCDILNLIIRFRFNQVAITGDLEKMFRQIIVHADDRKYQHILWRDQSNGKLMDYQLNTVTYGTASASYLATKCLQQLAYDEESKFPLASASAREDTYMDDVVTGAADDDAAITLTDQLIALFKTGGFQIRKLMSNSQKLMEQIPMALRGVQGEDIFGAHEDYKMLGISWDFVADQFRFKVPEFQFRPRVTKRTLSSDIARIFDPLGWLGPFIIKAKMLLQRVWAQEIGWDQVVSQETAMDWQELFDQFHGIPEIKLPRCVILPRSTKFEIHGFSDASEIALCANIYIVSVGDDGTRKSSLLVAKTKVAPMKVKSIPKLELSAAAMLAQLFTTVIESVSTRITQNFSFSMYAWSDSTIALRWIQTEPRRWKTFVANRIALIQTTIPNTPWGHVATQENPADLGSRGLNVAELAASQLWWQGPTWLRQAVPVGNVIPEVDTKILEEERKKNFCLTVRFQENSLILTKYSSLHKLLGVTAYVLRVCKKIKPKNLIVTADERSNALKYWIRKTQSIGFNNELKSLAKDKTIRSSLKAYSPFIDDDGLLRVGGRLKNALHLEEAIRHPILLPKDSHLSMLIVRMEHWKNLHAGPTLLISTVRQTYFILGLRDLATRITKKCVICSRFRASSLAPKMADLHSSRVTPSFAWEHTGCDFAGPLLVRTWKGRGFKAVKAYICVFICFSSKAIHLELVSELSTSAFLAALERFISLRGRPAHFHSDNGTNFVGAERVLHEYFTHPDVQGFFATEGITWHFSPPSGPHFGGLWEAAVKSTKAHLTKVSMSYSFTYEETTTLLTKISCCLNSRPLYPISNDPTSYEVLTPGHFLIGKPMNSLPNPNVRHLKWNSMDRWQKIEQTTQRFWDLWSKHYLLELQKRGKWAHGDSKPQIQVGDLVIIHEDNAPPAKWKLGRVATLKTGADGHVRIVQVKTATGEMTRPVVKLSILPVHEG